MTNIRIRVISHAIIYRKMIGYNRWSKKPPATLSLPLLALVIFNVKNLFIHSNVEKYNNPNIHIYVSFIYILHVT